MAAAVVHVEILVDVDRGIVERVRELVHDGAAGVRALGPRVAPRPAVPGHDDEVTGAGGADGVDGRLVVPQHQLRRHVVRLVHQPEDDLVVVGEAARELAPELAELRRRGGGGVRGVADHAAAVRLRARVVVAHVVVRVQDGVRALGDGHVVDRLLEVVEVGLVKCLSEAGCDRGHPLEQERDAEEVEVVLVDVDVDAGLVDEFVVDAERAWQTGPWSGIRGPDSKLATRLSDAGIVDGGRSRAYQTREERCVFHFGQSVEFGWGRSNGLLMPLGRAASYTSRVNWASA